MKKIILFVRNNRLERILQLGGITPEIEQVLEQEI